MKGKTDQKVSEMDKIMEPSSSSRECVSKIAQFYTRGEKLHQKKRTGGESPHHL